MQYFLYLFYHFYPPNFLHLSYIDYCCGLYNNLSIFEGFDLTFIFGQDRFDIRFSFWVWNLDQMFTPTRLVLFCTHTLSEWHIRDYYSKIPVFHSRATVQGEPVVPAVFPLTLFKVTGPHARKAPVWESVQFNGVMTNNNRLVSV